MDYNIKDFAALAGVNVQTIRRKIKTGQVKAKTIEGKYGPQYMIPDSELDKVIITHEIVEVNKPIQLDQLTDTIKAALAARDQALIDKIDNQAAARDQALIYRLDDQAGIIRAALNEKDQALEVQAAEIKALHDKLDKLTEILEQQQAALVTGQKQEGGSWWGRLFKGK